MKEQFELRGRFVVVYRERKSTHHQPPKFNGENNIALCGCVDKGESLESFIKRRNKVIKQRG